MRPRLSLKARGLQCLAKREHSRSELRRKLLAHLQGEARARQRELQALAGGHLRAAAGNRDDNARDDPDAGHMPEAALADMADHSTDLDPAEQEAQVEAALDWLAAQRHLSDERFVESRIHVRAPRFGNLRIRRELAQHGVELSPEATAQLKASELERARAVWRRRFGASVGEPPADAAERARQTRFLTARGFSADVIRRVLRGDDGC